MRITVMLTARSDGYKYRPFVLLNRQRPIKEIVERFGQKLELCWRKTDWMNDECIQQYLETTFKKNPIVLGCISIHEKYPNSDIFTLIPILYPNVGFNWKKYRSGYRYPNQSKNIGIRVRYQNSDIRVSIGQNIGVDIKIRIRVKISESERKYPNPDIWVSIHFRISVHSEKNIRIRVKISVPSAWG